MTPSYELRVWPEGDWWLARVVGASDGADPTPLNALTQARSQAKSARTWLGAAQQLWQERATVAARTLAGQGYSLREVAVLLGLSHQRVDQLLGGHADDEQTSTVVVHFPGHANSGNDQAAPSESPNIDALLVIRGLSARDPETTFSGSELEAQLREQATSFLQDLASRTAPDPPGAGFDNARAV